MVYNEAALLPIWARHYARQVGADQCYVIDHGSTDDLVLPPGVNVLRLPRSPHDDARRAAFIAKLAAGLLGYFDWIIHTDVDELVLANPARYRNLPDFCADSPSGTVTTIGLDVQHVPTLEPRLDPSKQVGAQRSWARFTSAMCKPVLTRNPTAWAPGFHGSDQGLVFGDLFLFHLHWADRELGLDRLAKTRTMPWHGAGYGAHARITDEQWSEIFDGMAGLPRAADRGLEIDSPPVQPWLARTMASAAGREHDTYGIDLHINAPELWPIPNHFRARL